MDSAAAARADVWKPDPENRLDSAANRLSAPAAKITGLGDGSADGRDVFGDLLESSAEWAFRRFHSDAEFSTVASECAAGERAAGECAAGLCAASESTAGLCAAGQYPADEDSAAAGRSADSAALLPGEPAARISDAIAG